MVTLEDIEKEVSESVMIRFQMNQMIKQLKKATEKMGVEIVKDLLLGRRKLSLEEFTAASKQFGMTAVIGISRLENLNTAQKQYIFKRMGWDISEVK